MNHTPLDPVDLEVDVHGGLVSEIRVSGRLAALGPITTRVLDYDVEGADEDEIHLDTDGEEFAPTTATAKAEPLRSFRPGAAASTPG